jgi:uncharacterized protein
MQFIIIVLACFALLGHAALWIGYVNRVHAINLHKYVAKGISSFGYDLLFIPPLVTFAWWLHSGQPLGDWLIGAAQIKALWFYVVLCWIVAAIIIALWAYRRWLLRPPALIQSHRTTVVNMTASRSQPLAIGQWAKVFSHFPGNQFLELAIEELEIALPRLSPQLDGLSMVHLSDLHMTGQIAVDFFHDVVDRANALRPDMMVITGDIVDHVGLLNWIPQTLGRLEAPLGVYFVLGNHDAFTRHAPLVRQALTGAGLIDVAGRWHRLEAAGAEIVLAGNERPWFNPAPDLNKCPQRTPDEPQLRLLLAHTPDCFRWARRGDFDLMLAGHTHGGQVRFPLIGPILSPSWRGVKYASGTFYSVPTLMHVSRGLSAETPLRLNCRPELAKIVLRADRSSQLNTIY